MQAYRAKDAQPQLGRGDDDVERSCPKAEASYGGVRASSQPLAPPCLGTCVRMLARPCAGAAPHGRSVQKDSEVESLQSHGSRCILQLVCSSSACMPAGDQRSNPVRVRVLTVVPLLFGSWPATCSTHTSRLRWRHGGPTPRKCGGPRTFAGEWFSTGCTGRWLARSMHGT